MPSRLSSVEILKICADENFGLFSKVVQAKLILYLLFTFIFIFLRINN